MATAWDETALNELIRNNVPEDRNRDYKSALVLKTDDEKREFLKDVSSFANSIGGTLFYGVEETKLLASGLPGIEISNLDVLTRQLDELLRTGLQPRLRGVLYQAVQLANGRYVLLVSVGQSFDGPHMVAKPPSAFYARGAASNFQLDAFQLREAFLLSENVTKRAHDFRIDRLAKISSGQGAVPLNETAQLVVHVMPAGSFSRNLTVDLGKLHRSSREIFPRLDGAFPRDRRYCLDGYVEVTSDPQEKAAAYALLFRNGCYEIVDALSCGEYSPTGGKLFYPHTYEGRLREAVRQAIDSLVELEVPSPYFVGLSVLSCLGFGLFRASAINSGYRRLEIAQMVWPEGSIADWDGRVDPVLHPFFDMIFNAFGYPRSPNYDPQGEWKPSIP